jgi:hypothetical protein
MNFPSFQGGVDGQADFRNYFERVKYIVEGWLTTQNFLFEGGVAGNLNSEDKFNLAGVVGFRSTEIYN